MAFTLTDEDSNQYTILNPDFVDGFTTSIKRNIVSIAFAHGGRDIGDQKLAPRTLRVKSVITGSDAADYQTKWDSFMAAMAKPNQTFAYKAGRYINVDSIDVRSHAFIIGDLAAIAEFDLYCADPFWYADSETTESTWTVTSSPDTDSYTNTGNVEVFPTIEITASADLGSGIELKNQTDDNTLFTYTDSSFTSGKKLTVNCKLGTVNLDGTNTIRFFEGQFLRLLVGANTLEYTGGNCAIVLKHRDRWL